MTDSPDPTLPLAGLTCVCMAANVPGPAAAALPMHWPRLKRAISARVTRSAPARSAGKVRARKRR